MSPGPMRNMMMRKYRNNNGDIVLATGVFDLLHYGHLRFLEEAKKGKNVTKAMSPKEAIDYLNSLK